jgi:hypothetical protein
MPEAGRIVNTNHEMKVHREVTLCNVANPPLSWRRSKTSTGSSVRLFRSDGGDRRFHVAFHLPLALIVKQRLAAHAAS